MTIPTNYYDILAQIESGGNPNAHSPTSSASGLYQFTKGTWSSLGLDWSNVFDVGQQNQAIQTLTNQNATILSNKGVPITNQSLYAAHFFGAGTASNILNPSVSNGTPLSSLVSSNAISANPFLAGMTKGDFTSWLDQKVSVGQSSGGGILDQALNGAQDIIGNTIGNIPVVGDVLGALGIGGSSSSSSDNIFSQFIHWLENLFSVNTASRFVAVIAGVGLVIVAIIFLTNADKIIVETGKAAALAA